MTTASEVRSTPITVLVVGGTGESFPGDPRIEVSGLLQSVTDELDERFVCRWIGYPASYGPTPQRRGMSYEDSVADGVAALRRALCATSTPIMVIGYSQGAVVIREALHGWSARGDVDRIIGVGLVADPHQPPGVVDGCHGWGVAGPGSPLPQGIPAFWVGNPDDVICNASPDSLIRDIADLTAAMTLGDTMRWSRSVVETVCHNAFQNAHRTALGPRQWRRDIDRLRTAGREVLGYLPRRVGWGSRTLLNQIGGRHTSYSVESYRHTSITNADSTGCQALSRWMQVQATFTDAAAPTSTDAVAPTNADTMMADAQTDGDRRQSAA